MSGNEVHRGPSDAQLDECHRASLRNLIHEHARKLTAGEFLAAAQDCIFPSVLRVGSYELKLSSVESTAEHTRTYFRNLAVECYRRTEVEISHLSIMSKTKAYALATWKHVNDRGSVIDEVETGYFFELCDDGAWRFGLGEIAKEPTQRYAAGLPLVASQQRRGKPFI